MFKKILFLDRDGTLIEEPEDKQVDSISKLSLKKNVIPALLKLQQSGYVLVMITNQDGLGTESFQREQFEIPQQLLMTIFSSQGVFFQDILICPHFANDSCLCRKPNVGLVMNYLKQDTMDFNQSYVIGDRETDMQLADNMGIKKILYTDNEDWLQIAESIINTPRIAEVHRVTKETDVTVAVNLDRNDNINVNSGLAFFDHMLEQIAKHGGFSISLNVKGDMWVDEHHTVEDTALTLGTAIRQALGDKFGINRYGFLMPMDEALAEIAIDISGRSFCVFDGRFNREMIGGFPTELVSHFIHSFSESLGAAIHVKVKGENTHHMIESIFKGMGQCLRQAMNKTRNDVLSTKGVL